MKNILKIGTLLIFIMIMSISSVQAQEKYGYVNSQELIVMLPESKSADSQLETFQKQLGEAFQKKIEKFRSDVAAFEQAAQSGNLNQIQIQEQGTALGKREQDLAKEEQELVEKVNNKRMELLEPIINKINDAIKAVGKEGNYTMIFDSSGMNVMLYLDDAFDVMEQVKGKLGL